MSIFSTKLEGCLIVMALMLAIETSLCDGGKNSGGAGSGGGSDSMSEATKREREKDVIFNSELRSHQSASCVFALFVVSDGTSLCDN